MSELLFSIRTVHVITGCLFEDGSVCALVLKSQFSMLSVQKKENICI